jgi:hypothetical protein
MLAAKDRAMSERSQIMLRQVRGTMGELRSVA